MKYFVPRFRHDIPNASSDIMNAMLIEIDERDLNDICTAWKVADELTGAKAKAFFASDIKKICSHKFQKDTFEPFSRRPHITVHSGAKPGNADFKEFARDLMYRTGKLVAEQGFNLKNGGYTDGLMGAVIDGFNDQLKIQRHPDQYSIQVMPGTFVTGVKSVNGAAPTLNETLITNTDAAIIFPDFMARRDVLNNQCIAGITGLGASGSLDESTDIFTHKKTGQRDTHLYMLSPPLESVGLDGRFWDGVKRQFDTFIVTGLEHEDSLRHIHFLDTPEEIMDNLMAKLDAEGNNPHTLYQEYCRAHNIPALSSAPAPAPAAPQP